jgi:hypothetical protein
VVRERGKGAMEIKWIRVRLRHEETLRWDWGLGSGDVDFCFSGIGSECWDTGCIRDRLVLMIVYRTSMQSKSRKARVHR